MQYNILHEIHWWYWVVVNIIVEITFCDLEGGKLGLRVIKCCDTLIRIFDTENLAQGHILTNFYIIAFLLRHSDKFLNVHSVTIKMLCNHKSNYWTLEVFNLIPNICQFFLSFSSMVGSMPGHTHLRGRDSLSVLSMCLSPLWLPQASPLSQSLWQYLWKMIRFRFSQKIFLLLQCAESEY